MAHKIVVRAGILSRPLLVTDKAQAVEVYDDDDNLIAVMHRVFADSMWAVTTKTDPDWEATICQFGYVEGTRKFSPQIRGAT